MKFYEQWIKHSFFLTALALSGCAEKKAATAANTEPKERTAEVIKDEKYGGILLPPDKARVSLVQLLANPREFDNHWVETAGYLSMSFEDSALYMHKDDKVHGLRMNSLWISLEAYAAKKPVGSNRYVIVYGLFSAKQGGHLGLWSGSINAASIREPVTEEATP